MDPRPLNPPARLIFEPYEVDLRLHQLGVTRTPLEEAVRQGSLQRRLCTADDFYGAPGYLAWARALRVTRQELRKQHGWHKGDFLRIPVAYNEDESVAVAVSSGDDRVGLPGDDPSTKEKGPSTVAAVGESSQPELQFASDEIGVDLWYLLTYESNEGELRAELSSPRFTDEEDKISGWYERVIFGRIDFDGEPQVMASDATTDFSINVTRKSA
jgi:hypothetical protein